MEETYTGEYVSEYEHDEENTKTHVAQRSDTGGGGKRRSRRRSRVRKRAKKERLIKSSLCVCVCVIIALALALVLSIVAIAAPLASTHALSAFFSVLVTYFATKTEVEDPFGSSTTGDPADAAVALLACTVLAAVLAVPAFVLLVSAYYCCRLSNCLAKSAPGLVFSFALGASGVSLIGWAYFAGKVRSSSLSFEIGFFAAVGATACYIVATLVAARILAVAYCIDDSQADQPLPYPRSVAHAKFLRWTSAFAALLTAAAVAAALLGSLLPLWKVRFAPRVYQYLPSDYPLLATYSYSMVAQTVSDVVHPANITMPTSTATPGARPGPAIVLVGLVVVCALAMMCALVLAVCFQSHTVIWTARSASVVGVLASAAFAAAFPFVASGAPGLDGLNGFVAGKSGQVYWSVPGTGFVACLAACTLLVAAAAVVVGAATRKVGDDASYEYVYDEYDEYGEYEYDEYDEYEADPCETNDAEYEYYD